MRLLIKEISGCKECVLYYKDLISLEVCKYKESTHGSIAIKNRLGEPIDTKKGFPSFCQLSEVVDSNKRLIMAEVPEYVECPYCYRGFSHSHCEHDEVVSAMPISLITSNVTSGKMPSWCPLPKVNPELTD